VPSPLVLAAATYLADTSLSLLPLAGGALSPPLPPPAGFAPAGGSARRAKLRVELIAHFVDRGRQFAFGDLPVAVTVDLLERFGRAAIIT
jgi:hypothetical protein